MPSDISDLPYEEIVNSPVMKDVRLQMMHGKLPDQCKLCKNSNYNDVYKDLLNSEFKHTFKEIVDKTSTDGATTMKPLFLDYRFLNCNLTCMTCNPFFSSKWVGLAKEKGLHHIPKNDTFEFLNTEYKRILREYQWERISFAGGEPLVQVEHLTDLAALLEKDNKLEKGISLSYNTNLMKDSTFIEEWISIINKFKNPGIMVSVDSYGLINDLIRVGASFEKISENLKIITSLKNPHVRLHIDLTMTSLFFFNLIEYSQWIIENNFELNARVVINQFSGKFLHFEILPLAFRENKFSEWSQWYDQLSEDKQKKLRNLKQVLETFYKIPELPFEDRVQAIVDVKRMYSAQHAKLILAMMENVLLNSNIPPSA